MSDNLKKFLADRGWKEKSKKGSIAEWIPPEDFKVLIRDSPEGSNPKDKEDYEDFIWAFKLFCLSIYGKAPK